jgi:valyl-tRNA synthetase
MGHALNNTLQDVLIRWRRMQGFNAEWLPGTDHAGIATQAVVERLIYQLEKKTRHDLGREELVRRIWQWKDQYEARILGQLKQLGCSCDWDRTRFTFDEGNNRAVRTTFFRWFRDGYIFRGKRLVNWDTQLQTSVADDETYTEETKGGFWTFKYPILDSSGKPSTREFIRFSTTRPETMLGDTAVCVHPEDPRYRHLIGKTAWQPLVQREIPIIADGLLADPQLGTGCVKVTPAHDPNDYACGIRHRLPMINILNPDGTINSYGGKYVGMDRYRAREAIVKDMEELGLFEGREDRMIPLAYSDRSKTPIEPFLSDQWFVRMGDLPDRPGLAQLAIDAVTSGRIRFFPDRYRQTYLEWLSEKRDWCISRQLWWGHRIPVWYAQCPEAELRRVFQDRDDVCWKFDEENVRWMICSMTDLPADLLGEKYRLEQDPDVLDTWFSSQLWPYATFGWPDDTPELRYYYPTSSLVTSRDIITLWVARMVLSGLYNVGDIPFRHVYITPKLLDGFGVTMSKSKGNGVDPLDIIELYGADALRYQMVFLAGETQDSRLPVTNVCPHCGEQIPVKPEHMYMRTAKLTCPKCKGIFRPGGPWPAPDPNLPTAKQGSKDFEVGRNFANKLWNAARMVLLNLEGYRPEGLRVSDLPIEDRWILSRLSHVTEHVTSLLENYHFSDVARTLYDFIWSEFCDWYLEMCKGRLKSEDSHKSTEERLLAQRVLVGVLDGIVRLIHPVMPFVAESIWQSLNDAAFERGLPEPHPAAESVMIAPWPEFPISWQDGRVDEQITHMQTLVRGVREIRNQFMVPERESLQVSVRCSEEFAALFRSMGRFISQLAGVRELECGPEIAKPKHSATKIHSSYTIYVSLSGLIDPEKERQRLSKQLSEKQKLMQMKESKLANESFIARAPAEIVQQEREAIADLKRQIEMIQENLRDLSDS